MYGGAVRWLLVAALCAAGVVGFHFWEARLVAEGDAAGYARAKAEYTASALKAEAKARADSARMQKEKDDAEIEAAQRQVLQKRDAERLRAERDGLRGDLSAAREHLRDAPVEAVRLYAISASDVFEQCVRSYSDLAEKADGHSSDTLKMLRAWPVSP
jgi:cell division protein FtsL